MHKRRAQPHKGAVEQRVCVRLPPHEAGEVAQLEPRPHAAPRAELVVGLAQEAVTLLEGGRVLWRRQLRQERLELSFLARLARDHAQQRPHAAVARHRLDVPPRRIGAANQSLDELGV